MSNSEIVKALEKAVLEIRVAKNSFDPMNQQFAMSKALKALEKALELIKNEN